MEAGTRKHGWETTSWWCLRHGYLQVEKYAPGMSPVGQGRDDMHDVEGVLGAVQVLRRPSARSLRFVRVVHCQHDVPANGLLGLLCLLCKNEETKASEISGQGSTAEDVCSQAKHLNSC